MLEWYRSIMNSGSVLGYFFQAIPITLFVGIIYALIKAISLKKKKEKVNWLREIIKCLFVCYLTGLISLVILPANFWLSFFDGALYGWWDEIHPFFEFGGFNFVPSVLKALSGELIIGSWVKTMLIGNMLMFLPFGFFLPFITDKVNRKNIFAVSVAVPFLFELLQLLTYGRSFDVDDLICNFIGIVLGFFLARVLCSRKRKHKTTENP